MKSLYAFCKIYDEKLIALLLFLAVVYTLWSSNFDLIFIALLVPFLCLRWVRHSRLKGEALLRARIAAQIEKWQAVI